jgi:hypothetical protein
VEKRTCDHALTGPVLVDSSVYLSNSGGILTASVTVPGATADCAAGTG